MDVFGGYMKSLLFRILSITSVGLLISCNGGGGSGTEAAKLESYPVKPATLRINLTDAPIDDIKEVNVNVKQIELNMSGLTQRAKVVVGQDFGMVDLLTLRNGTLLPVHDLEIPVEASITLHQIRLVLDGSNNHLIRNDGSRCDLQTPSAQKTGVKIIIPGGVTFEPGYSYSLVVDFDAEKSIVLKGNGGCLLKPVLKLKAFTRMPETNVDDEGGNPVDPEEPSDDLLGGEEPVNDGEYDDGDDLEDFPILIDPDTGWVIY